MSNGIIPPTPKPKMSPRRWWLLAAFLTFFVLCGVGIVYGVQHAQEPPANHQQ